MPRRRSSLEDLGRALRLAEPNAKNLSRYLEDTWEHVAVLLGVEASEIRALINQPDQEIAPKLSALLHHREEARAARCAERGRGVALSAADHLAFTAVQRANRIYLDPGILFGALLADTSCRYIAFCIYSEAEVRIRRPYLVQVAEVLTRQYDDLGAWLDNHGLHIRWKGGRGGLNLISQRISARDMGFGLRIRFTPHVESVAPAVAQDVERQQPRPQVSRPKARPHLGDELASMALLS